VNGAGVEQVMAMVNEKVGQIQPKLASVKVTLGADKSADLVLRKGDTIEEAARQFCQQHQIDVEGNLALLVSALEAEYDTQQSEVPSSEANNDSIPEGWVRVLDEASGKYYYAHPESGRSAWQKPTADTASEAAQEQQDDDELMITEVDEAGGVIEEQVKQQEAVEQELPSIVLDAANGVVLFELPLTIDGTPRPLTFRGGDNATKVAIEWCETYNGDFNGLSVVLDEVLRRFAEYKRIVEPSLTQPLAKHPVEASLRKTLAQGYSQELAEMVLAAERPAGEWLFALAVQGSGELLGVPVRAGDKPRELAEKWCQRKGISLREAPVIAAMVVQHYQNVYLWEQSWLDEIALLLVVLACGYFCGSMYEKWIIRDKTGAAGAAKLRSPTSKKGQKSSFASEKKQSQGGQLLKEDAPGLRRRGKMCIM